MQTRQVEVFLLKNVRHGFEIVSHCDMSKGLFADEYTVIGSGIATITLLDADADEGVEV